MGLEIGVVLWERWLELVVGLRLWTTIVLKMNLRENGIDLSDLKSNRPLIMGRGNG
jgi:hypothetical protein